jgi:hypothetical protein
MRSLDCPICQKTVLIYEKDGKIYPNLEQRIRQHIESHSLEHILNFYYDNFYTQVVKFQDEMEASNSQEPIKEANNRE